MATDVGRLEAIFDEHLKVAHRTRESLLPDVATLAAHLMAAFAAGGKLLIFGNGGSAADAQHFAGELLGHYHRERRSLPAIALTTDSSTLTGIANDYSYESVFARQVEALCGAGDVALGISTSGNAVNVLRGIAAARRLGATTWALTGSDGRQIMAAAEYTIGVPSNETARIQEMHLTIIHAVSELIDADAAGGSAS